MGRGNSCDGRGVLEEGLESRAALGRTLEFSLHLHSPGQLSGHERGTAPGHLRDAEHEKIS